MPRLFEQFGEEPKILPHAVIRKRHPGCDAALGVAPPAITKVHYRRMPGAPGKPLLSEHKSQREAA